MNWSDVGIVLSVRRHGEASAIVSLMTERHGRHAGLVRGAKSTALRAVLQPGNLVTAEWRARLSDHLGSFTLDPIEMRAAAVLQDHGRLLGLTSACALVERVMPEREPADNVFDLLSDLTGNLPQDGWEVLYIRWEMAMLTALGFGLSLSECAATGAREDLIYVSPKSGRAVSRAAGAPYREKLLALPAFLGSPADDPNRPVPAQELADGLRLTGYFMARHVADGPRPALPDARDRLLDRFVAQGAECAPDQPADGV